LRRCFISFGGDFKIVQELVKRDEATPQDIKFFLGYSGWGENQLEDEIARNSWLTTTAKPSLVFNKMSQNEWWRKAVFQTPHFYVANFPENAYLN
jgi:putative transcriptional regulator